MNNIKWNKKYNNYFSYHILIKYLGDYLPKYTVLENPDDEGWIIGIFFTFTGEYTPLEEDEKRLIFQTLEEAQEYVDHILNVDGKEIKIQIAGCYLHQCGHNEMISSPLVNNDEQFTLNMLKKRACISDCWKCKSKNRRYSDE